jgi:hypothetical protein
MLGGPTGIASMVGAAMLVLLLGSVGGGALSARSRRRRGVT